MPRVRPKYLPILVTGADCAEFELESTRIFPLAVRGYRASSGCAICRLHLRAGAVVELVKLVRSEWTLHKPIAYS